MRRSTRISRASQPDPVMRETRPKSRRTPNPMELTTVDAELSVGGVRVTDMNRDTLRKHVRGMGLKPKGPLKADLQRCLWDHLRRSSCGDGIDKGGDSGPHEDAEGGSAEERKANVEDDAGDGKYEARAEVEDGKDEKVANGPSPGLLLYKGIQISLMEEGTMSEILKYLDVSSARRNGDEMAHDLVKALLLRRAEATAINRKQRWRGSLVSKMNKTELTTALRSFGADDSGKVVVLRARLHKLVRRWATTEILLTENVGGGSIDGERGSHRGGVEEAEIIDDARGKVPADTEAHVDWHQATDIPPLNRDGDIVGGGDTSTAGDSDGVVVNPAVISPEGAVAKDVGMPAEDSQGSRCQVGVTSPSSLSTIEGAEVGEVTVEATPEVESQGIGDPRIEKQPEPTVGQGQAELPPVQSMELPRLGFTFTRCDRTKRGRSSVADGADLDAFVSAEDDSHGVFEFATVQRVCSRRTRRRRMISTSSMAPRVSGGHSRDNAAVMGTTRDFTKGFDMSLFKKPGEWKCEACLVRNPPGRDACLSCETPKPVVEQGGDSAHSGATAGAPIAPSTIGGALLAGKDPSNIQTFTFGGQPAREIFKEIKDNILAGDDGERNAEFGFPIRRKHRAPAAAGKSFTFTRCTRTKRGRSSVVDGADLDAFVSTEDDSLGVFEFATVQRVCSRRTRRRRMISSTSSTAPRVSGGHSSDNAAVMGTTRDFAKGFDMSLFKKPGEWKCEACLVRNPPGQDACLSCETPKPVVGQGWDSAHSGATAVAPIAPSTIGGALFAGTAPSNNQTFTFGGQPAED